jgi:hypothetical protein
MLQLMAGGVMTLRNWNGPLEVLLLGEDPLVIQPAPPQEGCWPKIFDFGI